MTVEAPDKVRLLELLAKAHALGVPNWTTAEMQEAHEALRQLGFLWFRSEEFEGNDC